MSRKHHHPKDDEAHAPAGADAPPPGQAAPVPAEAPPGAEAAPPPLPPPTPDELARLRTRAAEADVLEDRLKRAQAEFVNESKRIARQAEQDRRFAVEQMAKDLVPLAEGLGSALAAAGSVAASQPLKDGVALVAKQLEDVLARYGIELLRPTAGQPFDPAAHEAILVVERTDVPPQHVADVIRPGFRLHGRVVRPAQVTVAKAPAAPEAAAPTGA